MGGDIFDMMKEHGAEKNLKDMALDDDFRVDVFNAETPVKKEVTKVAECGLESKAAVTPQRLSASQTLPRYKNIPSMHLS